VVEFGYVPALQRVSRFRLVGVADPDPVRPSRAASGVPAYRELPGLLGAGGVDALVIASPASDHRASARLAANAGVPALVEKPPAPDAREATGIAALDPAPWIGFNRRFSGGFQDLRRGLDRGREYEIEIEMRYRRRSWRPVVVSDDALLDLGPHLVDLARWLGRTDVLRARALELSRDRAAFSLDLGRVRARIACACDRPYRERIEVRDRRGDRIARLGSGGLASGLIARVDRRRAHPLVESLTLQLEAFARAVRGEAGPHPATARDGVAAMLAIDAVRRSAADGGAWRDVAMPPRGRPGER
jgi:predicted dehydrogenase